MADGRHSCCKWGRANGWGMLSHIEVLAAVAAFPGHPLTAPLLSGYRARVKAVLAVGAVPACKRCFSLSCSVTIIIVVVTVTVVVVVMAMVRTVVLSLSST